MPRDPEADRFLKSLGGNLGGPAPPEPGSGAQAAPSRTSDDDDGILSGIGHGLRGVAEGAGAEIESGLELIPKYKGTAVSNWLKAKTDVDPEEGMVETAGRFAGGMLPWMAIPEVGLGAMAERFAAKQAYKYFPKVIKGARGRFAANPAAQSGIGGFAHQSLPGLARAAGRGTELAGIGGAAGAVEDPEHPIKGAALGAGAAIAPIGLGQLAAKSGLAQHALSHVGRHKIAEWAATGFLGHALGLGYVPLMVYPMFAWGPGGRLIRNAGHLVLNKAGQVIAAIPDRVTNAAAAGAGTLGAAALKEGTSIGDEMPGTPTTGQLPGPAPTSGQLPGPAPLPPPTEETAQ